LSPEEQDKSMVMAAVFAIATIEDIEERVTRSLKFIQ